MRAAEDLARAARQTRITLHTTPRMPAAHRMHRWLGYERTQDHVLPDGFVLLCHPKLL